MNKLLLFILLSLSVSSYAKVVNAEEASNIAQQLNRQLSSIPTAKNDDKGIPSLTLTKTVANNDSVFYYIFNRGNDNGFMIISGDTRAKDILAYSYEGHIDCNDIPANMQFWLDSYANDMRIILSQPDNMVTPKVTESPNEVIVAPLLSSKWAQNKPYNNLCPTLSDGSKSAVGCVANVMAQLMYYYHYPTRGKGSYSYTSDTNKFELSADFDTEYQYSSMTDVYTNESSAEANNAVAKLMLHCGISVGMDYDTSSAAYTADARKAMIAYFGYSSTSKYIPRYVYSDTQWLEIAKKELDAAQPIIYRGTNDKGGHVFMIDGYDSGDMLHINWGWGGARNGYFSLGAFNPWGTLLQGYNYSHYMITGLVPDPSSGVSDILENNDNTVTIFPNPAHDSATVNAPSEILQISIFSITGNMVYNNLYNGTSCSESIDISSLPASTYIATVITTNGNFTNKLIKR